MFCFVHDVVLSGYAAQVVVDAFNVVDFYRHVAGPLRLAIRWTAIRMEYQAPSTLAFAHTSPVISL